ncbi:MAG: polysaccharide biosynthesis protein [Methanosarcinales archaeon]|nr:polysaccharide biosynthesis protein [Methanosarcinales archaeon]
MQMYQKSFADQLPRNLIANILFFITNIVIGILLIPYFIDTLGVASYGLIPLATSITSYVGLVAQSLNTSVSRYLTVDLQREDFEKANITFNTSLFGIIGVILVLIPVIFVVSYYVPIFFQTSLNQQHDVILLFLGVMGAFLVKTLSSVYGVSLFAYNRLDIQNIINVINVFVQVGLIVLLFTEFSPNLSYVGLSYLIGALVAFIITISTSKKVNPHLKVNYSDFRTLQLKELAGMGNWVIVNQIGALLFLQVDLIVVNKLFGLTAGGEYATILIWSILLRSMAGMFAGVLAPIILTYYAKDQIEQIITISRSAVKFMGLTMALPIGLICGFAPQLLSLWVGPEFMKLAPLMWILLSHLIINLSVLPLFSINISFNKVRIPGLVTLFMGVGNFLLAITIPYITGWGYYGVAVAGFIMLTMKNSIFTPWYTTRVIGIPKHTFTKSILLGSISMVAIIGFITMLNHYFNISSLISLIVASVVITLAYMIIIWFVGLNESECKMMKSFIPFQTKRD